MSVGQDDLRTSTTPQFYKWVDVGIPDPASADKLGQIDNIWDDFNLPLSLCLLGRMISERARLLSCSLFGRSGRLPHSTPAVREYQSSQGTLGCVRLSCNSDFPIDKLCNCQVVFYSRVVPWTCVWRWSRLCVFVFVACCVGGERREGRGVDRNHPFLS